METASVVCSKKLFSLQLQINIQHNLGGSFVGTSTVLIAAHCVDGGTHGTAIFGAHFWREAETNQRRVEFTQTNIHLHPSWNPLLIQNDIAVIRWAIPIPTIPSVIRAAILPALTDQNYDFANEYAVASGWGVHTQGGGVSDHLRHVYDNIITVDQCRISSIGTANANNICMTGTRNRGACNGDSGGK